MRSKVNNLCDISLYHNYSMKTLGERARERRLELKMTQRDVAKAAGLSQATISDIERGRNHKSTEITALARALKTSPNWLADERGSKTLSATSNVEDGPEFKKPIPVVSWVQAGNWTEAIDNLQNKDTIEWLLCPFCHSSSAFALRVRGESMFNPNGRPSFQEGDIIFVDPARRPENGSLVVVRLDDSNEATFKKLIIEGEKKYLTALNPAWPEKMIIINGNATICGVVFFKGEKY